MLIFLKLKKIDAFTKNTIIVFLGTSLVNLFNLLYQLLIAHNLNASDFAAFNTLLSLFMLISSPLGTMQIAVTRYVAEFNAQGQLAKIKFLLSDLMKKASLLAVVSGLVFCIFSSYIMNILRIPSIFSGYVLAILLTLSWLIPVFSGGVQGLERFGWFASASVLSGALKLLLAFIFTLLGYNITGALCALLSSSLFGLVILYFPLKHYICVNPVREPPLALSGNDRGLKSGAFSNGVKITREDFSYKQILLFLFPVATSYFCFIALVSCDMVLVKYFFPPQDAGFYSLAQMVGKIFLFLPGAISIVMFPRTTGLNVKNMDTISTLKRALFYGFSLCLAVNLIYNLFPSLILKILTGKIYPQVIILGKLFSISMSFFALLFILISYFLSIKDLRFIKYLVLFTLLQNSAILFFHQSLITTQLILCINSAILLLIHLGLAFTSPPHLVGE